MVNLTRPGKFYVAICVDTANRDLADIDDPTTMHDFSEVSLFTSMGAAETQAETWIDEDEDNTVLIGEMNLLGMFQRSVNYTEFTPRTKRVTAKQTEPRRVGRMLDLSVDAEETTDGS